MAGRRGVRQTRRRSHRRLRQDHRPWTYPRSPSTAACTKPHAAVKGPAPTPPTEPRSAGSGRSPPTCSPIPIGWVIDGANRGDSILLEPTLQAVAARGLLLDVETLHLDRGYDSALTTQRCHSLGVTDIVCAKKKRSAKKKPKGQAKPKKSLTLGLRWPVERTNSWFSNFGQLRRNTDRSTRQRLGQIALAVALILTCLLYTSDAADDEDSVD